VIVIVAVRFFFETHCIFWHVYRVGQIKRRQMQFLSS